MSTAQTAIYEMIEDEVVNEPIIYWPEEEFTAAPTISPILGSGPLTQTQIALGQEIAKKHGLTE
jgi:hypothetical protein